MKRWTERSCSHLMASVMAEEERGERIYSLLYFYSFTDHTRTYSVGMTDIVSDLSLPCLGPSVIFSPVRMGSLC